MRDPLAHGAAKVAITRSSEPSLGLTRTAPDTPPRMKPSLEQDDGISTRQWLVSTYDFVALPLVDRLTVTRSVRRP